MRHQAIRALYSSVVTIDHTGAYDADGKVVALNEENVTTKESELVARQVILDKIVDLEASITQRRVRDSGSDDAGGNQAGRDWMKAKEAAIATERAKL